jgi:hypothetical protein
MKREDIVAVAEAYLRQWNGCNAHVTTIRRRYNAVGQAEAIAVVVEGDGTWALRLGVVESVLMVLEDSLPADTGAV